MVAFVDLYGLVFADIPGNDNPLFSICILFGLLSVLSDELLGCRAVV